MKTKMNMWAAVLALFFVVGGLAIVSAAGFGVTSEYYSSRPMEIHSGESMQAFFILQNTADEDLRITASVTEGSEFASFLGGGVYTVPAGESLRVDMTVDIPAGIAEGTEYDIGVLFESEAAEGEGSVQLSTNIEDSFKAVVVEGVATPVESEGSNVWIWVVAIIIVIIIIWLIVRFAKR